MNGGATYSLRANDEGNPARRDRCRIGARRLEEVAAWIERYHQLWDARFGELDQVIEELKQKEKSDGRKKT